MADRKDEFSELLLERSSMLYAYILSMVHNPHDAEDLSQQTALTLWKKFDQYEPGTNFTAWACSVARYEVRNFLRRNSREDMVFCDELIEQITELAQHSYKAVSDRQDALRHCFKTLSPEQRRLVQCCYESGESVKDVSERIGRTPQSVHGSLRYIRSKLLECIERRLHEEQENHGDE